MWKIMEWQLFLNGRTSSLTDLLLTVLAGLGLAWYLQFLWKRRNLYQASLKLPGPLALPLIGSALYFLGNPYDTFGQISRWFNQYPGKFRVWFGPRLFYAVSEPRYFEILMTSPHALKKENLYRMAEPVTGQGLFSARSETAMGVQIKAQSTDSDFPKWVDRAMEIVWIRIFNMFFHSDLIFNMSSLGRDFRYAAVQLRSFTKKVLTEKQRLRSKNDIPNGKQSAASEGTLKRPAFLDLMMDINYEGNFHLTDEELMDETITVMIGGSDTTASINCFTLIMLGMHQEIQEKVLTEILEVVGPDGSVELKHLPQLKYLERVIKETLRLFPVAPVLVRTVDEDLDLGDLVIQKGCSVVFGILRVHRDETYWPDPFKFDPDRFLPEEVAKRSPGAFIPFSYGPRNCVGLKYGMMAMKTLVATVLKKYQVHTSYKSVEEIELKTNLMLRPKDGYKVSFELRHC